jgi:hypothetical protein
LEDFVARIDTPLLDSLDIMFFHQVILYTPQLAQFVARTPNIHPPVEARIIFFYDHVEITSPSRNFVLGIRCRKSDWQLSSLSQVCGWSFPKAFISTVEHLYISKARWWQSYRIDDIQHTQWLGVLRPFTTVKYLYLSSGFAKDIVPALQDVAGELLPSLQNLFLEYFRPSGPKQGTIEKLVAARQLAGHPIAVSCWDRKLDE